MERIGRPWHFGSRFLRGGIGGFPLAVQSGLNKHRFNRISIQNLLRPQLELIGGRRGNNTRPIHLLSDVNRCCRLKDRSVLLPMILHQASLYVGYLAALPSNMLRFP